MEQWIEIRQRILRDGVSKRQILRETGMHWETLQKILQHSRPPGYQRKEPVKQPKIGPYRDRIRQILEQDRHIHRKQRHTAKKIWEVLQEEGSTGGYTIVKDAVRELKRAAREVYMPLKHPPGEAQVDFGHALVKMNGVLRKICFFVMALPYSDAFFVRADGRECTETFWDGHVRAFAFFGGVPRRITYDNTRIALAKIIGPRLRELTEGFLQLVSHYLFGYHFCLVQRANEKGVVKGYTDRVRICRLHEVIAEHLRYWGREQQIFDPLHYLPLLERKPHCLAFGRPFEALDLPQCFEVLQHRMEWELGHGRREYVQLLRLLERYSLAQLTGAVEEALRRRVYSKDGVEQFLAGCRPWRQSSFTLGRSEHLRLVRICPPDVGAYGGLLGQGGAA